jgi:hypothetical protein
MSLEISIRFVIVALVVASTARGQAANDHCSAATPIGPGTTVGTNVGATTGPDPLGGCIGPGADVWYVFVAPCNGPWAASTCGPSTTIDTVLTVWDGSAGCGALLPVLCNDDFCGPPFSPSASYVTFESVAGTTYFVSVAGYLAEEGAFELTLEAIATELHFFSTGPGTIGYHVDGGPPAGTVFTAITLNLGFFPYGWFHGIDIDWPGLVSELSTGFPFVVPVGPVCGDVTVGPFSGLPAGLTVYGVSIGLPVGSSFPNPRFISTPEGWAVP